MSAVCCYICSTGIVTGTERAFAQFQTRTGHFHLNATQRSQTQHVQKWIDQLIPRCDPTWQHHLPSALSPAIPDPCLSLGIRWYIKTCHVWFLSISRICWCPRLVLTISLLQHSRTKSLQDLNLVGERDQNKTKQTSDSGKVWKVL